MNQADRHPPYGPGSGSGSGREARSEGKSPERRCIATGEVRPADELIRFVVGPEDQVVPDIEGNLPGRGMWVSASAPALRRAVEKGGFARAARRRVEVPGGADALEDAVRAGLRRRVLALLGLARKAGLLVAGHAKVEAAVGAGPILALFVARDAGAEGWRNAAAFARRTGAPLVADFSAEELSLALGRPNVIHAALTAGGPGKPRGARGRAGAGGRLADLVLGEVRRLRGFLEEAPR